MNTIRIALTCLILLAGAGCADQSELEDLRERLGDLRERLEDLRDRLRVAENELQEERRGSLINMQGYEQRGLHFQRQIARLENERDTLARQLSNRTEELAKQTEKLQKYRSYMERKKEAAAKQKREAVLKRQEMLEAARKANQPADAPFRVFDVLFIGRQTRDGKTQEYGRFSIRNYTTNPLVVRAWSTGERVKVTVPPDHVKKAIYVPAEKHLALHVQTTVGDQEYDWED